MAIIEKCMQQYKHIFRPDLLRGKVAFVTGGATGIGFAITEVLMRHGCDTAIASRKMDRLQHAASELQAATGAKCLPLQMDVRKPDTVIKAVDATLSQYGKIDILINSAAGNFLSPVTGLSYNAFRNVMDIDAMGVFNTSKTVYEKYFMNKGGVIVNISATLHYKGQIMQAHAGAAKAAIDALTKHMAVEWGQDKVRVVGLSPGPIGDTEGYRKLVSAMGEAAEESVRRSVPLGRPGTREEMANTVLFLVSQGAAYITGTTVVADGGSWLSSSNSMPLSPTGAGKSKL